MNFNNLIENRKVLIVIVVIVLLIISGLIGYTNYRENFDSKPLEQQVVYTKPLPIPIEKPKPKMEIILYYAMWCGYSKMFLPEWEKFEKCSNKFPTLKISKVRCEGDMEQMCVQKGINGYPMVILYKDNKEIPFEGDRTADQLVEFVKKHL